MNKRTDFALHLTGTEKDRGAKVITCDKFQLRIYEKTKRGKFDLNHYRRYHWSDLKKLETFHEVKSLLDR